MILLSGRLIQAYFNQNGQILVPIIQNMDTLREQNKQTSEILTTFGTASTGSPDEALEKLLDNAASHIANPCMRSGLRKRWKSQSGRHKKASSRVKYYDAMQRPETYLFLLT
jgi:hypothetical protein